MRANRAIYSMPLPLKTKNAYICRKIGIKTPRQLILEAGAKFMHKIVNTQTPPEIFDQLTFPRKFRRNARINIKTSPRTKKCRRSTIYSTLALFNSLHSSLKYVHPKIFKKLIEKRKILEIPGDWATKDTKWRNKWHFTRFLSFHESLKWVFSWPPGEDGHYKSIQML